MPAGTGRGGTVRLGLSGRILAAAGCLACGGVLALASWLTPSPTGEGTHTQLGLPPCGWVTAFGRPCPTCGMTTSFARAAHGQPLGAFRAQPFGLLLALGTAGAFWACLHAAATGSRVGPVYGRILTGKAIWVLAGLALAAWAYKTATWPAT